MISHYHKTIFVHIPKTGGQSVEMAFLANIGLDWEKRECLGLTSNDDPTIGPEELSHLTAREYLELGHISPALWQQYYKFTVVRNPFARAVSEYKFNYAQRGITFDEFLKAPIPAYPSDLARHLLPQYLFWADGIDVVKFERLSERWGEVSAYSRLGGSALPRMNVSADDRPWQSFYNGERAALVRERYGIDFARFGYSKEVK